MHRLLRPFRSKIGLLIVLFLAACTAVSSAQPPDSLDARIQKVMARPEFARSNFGIEFYDLETGKVVYALNPEKLFVPASTTKLLTEGTVLAKLGPGVFAFFFPQTFNRRTYFFQELRVHSAGKRYPTGLVQLTNLIRIQHVAYVA